jgi:hypothetical protein
MPIRAGDDSNILVKFPDLLVNIAHSDKISCCFAVALSVTNLDQPGYLLLTADLLARFFCRLVLGVGDETIGAAFQLRHQFLHDGVARLFARRIPLNRNLHLVLAGVVLVIDLRLFRHVRFSPVAAFPGAMDYVFALWTILPNVSVLFQFGHWCRQTMAGALPAEIIRANG